MIWTISECFQLKFVPKRIIYFREVAKNTHILRKGLEDIFLGERKLADCLNIFTRKVFC